MVEGGGTVSGLGGRRTRGRRGNTAPVGRGGAEDGRPKCSSIYTFMCLTPLPNNAKEATLHVKLSKYTIHLQDTESQTASFNEHQTRASENKCPIEEPLRE